MAKDCSVCAETKSSTQFPTSQISRKCTHTPTTCLPCITLAIKTELSSRPWEQIGCPECGIALEHQDVQKYADLETREKYDRLMVLDTIRKYPDFVWCSSGCGSGQLHDSGEAEPIVKCSLCGHLTCFQHKVAWHIGVTCEQFDLELANGVTSPLRVKQAYTTAEARRREKENVASEKIIKSTTKACPNCKSHIEKNGGCSHMTCSRCQRQFCWECARPWRSCSH